MKKEVEEYVKKCARCQLKLKRKVPMAITTTTRHCFEKCALDIIGPKIEKVFGSKYILTVQDDLSKFLVAVPIPQQDVESVAKEFVFNIVLQFGALAHFLTDQG